MKKRLLSILLSSALTISACPAAVSFADEEAAVVEIAAKNFSYKGMTFDEVIADISGNYAWMSGTMPEIIPVYKISSGGCPTVDENNKTHNINVAKCQTSIKMKQGKELPYDDIKAAVEAKRMIMPTIRKNGNVYELYSAVSKETYDYTLELIKACPDVVSIEMQYKLWEDTANYYQFIGVSYEGELTADELTAKYPELTPGESTREGALYFSFNNDDMDKLYEFFCRAGDNGDTFIPSGIQTCLGMMNPTYYYCNEPVLIDGTRGDANVDGYVDISDSVMIMQSIANPDSYGLSADKGISAQGMVNGDTDGDGLTNMDALNIQKSLLGMGDIEIPPRDSSIDFVVYDPVDFTEEYVMRRVMINDVEYTSTSVAIVKSEVGGEIGVLEAVDGEKNVTSSKVYAMKDMSAEAAVAVQYEGSNNYYVYTNWKYRPDTVGELVDGMNLSKTLFFTGVYANKFSPYRSVEYEAEKELIWDTLFSDRDIELLPSSTENDLKFRPKFENGKRPDNYVELEIGCDTPIFGRSNFALKVYPNGFVWSNLTPYGICFNISSEKAQQLCDFYNK